MAAAAAGSDVFDVRIHGGISLIEGSEIYAVQHDPANHVESIFEIDEDENDEMANAEHTLTNTASSHVVAPTRQKSRGGGESEHKERVNPHANLQLPIQYIDRTLRWCQSDEVFKNMRAACSMAQKEVIHIDTASTVERHSTVAAGNESAHVSAILSTPNIPVQARVQGAPFAAYTFSAHSRKIALLYKSLISQDGTVYKSGDLVYVKHSAFVPDATQQYKALKSRAWGEVVAFVELFTCERYERAIPHDDSETLTLSRSKECEDWNDFPLTDNEIANGIFVTDANELGMHVNEQGRTCVRSSIQLLFNWGLYPSDLKAYYPDLEDIYIGMPNHNKYSRFLSNYEQVVSVKAIDMHMPVKDAKNISARFNVNTSEVAPFFFSESAKRSLAVAHTNINPLQYVLNSIACDKELLESPENDEEPDDARQHSGKKDKRAASAASAMLSEGATKAGHSGGMPRQKRSNTHDDDPDYMEEEGEEIRIADSDEENNGAQCTNRLNSHAFCTEGEDRNIEEGEGNEEEGEENEEEGEENEEEEEYKAIHPSAAVSKQGVSTGATAAAADVENTGLCTRDNTPSRSKTGSLNPEAACPRAVSSRKRRRCIKKHEQHGDSPNSDDVSFVVEDSQETADSEEHEQSIALVFEPRNAPQDGSYTVEKHANMFKEAVFWNPAYLQHAPFWRKYVEDKFQFYQLLSCNNHELSVLNALISNMWKMDSYHVRATDGNCCFCKLRRPLSVAVILPMNGKTTNYAGACCFEKVKKVVTFLQIFETYRERLLRQFHAFATPNVLSMAQFQRAIMHHVWKSEFHQFETELNDALQRLHVAHFA
jgi:hypothetical protein